MPGSDGLGFLGILKKAVSWDLNLNGASWFSELGEARPLGVSELRADAGRTVSIVKIVCVCVCLSLSLSLSLSFSLSLYVENLKVKKVIKVSYLNQESRQCFGIPMPMNV